MIIMVISMTGADRAPGNCYLTSSTTASPATTSDIPTNAKQAGAVPAALVYCHRSRSAA